jgi:hypothetical protein
MDIHTRNIIHNNHTPTQGEQPRLDPTPPSKLFRGSKAAADKIEEKEIWKESSGVSSGT